MHRPLRAVLWAMPAMLGAGALSATFLEMVVVKAPLHTEIERRPEESGYIGITRRIGVAVIAAIIAIGRCRIASGGSVIRASAERETDGHRCGQ